MDGICGQGVTGEAEFPARQVLRRCRLCGGRRYWFSIYNWPVCLECHPLAHPSLVKKLVCTPDEMVYRVCARAQEGEGQDDSPPRQSTDRGQAARQRRKGRAASGSQAGQASLF